MSTNKKNGKALLAAIRHQKIDDEWNAILAMSDAELDAEIRKAGGDPEKTRAMGAALAEKLLERRQRNAWQVGEKAKLDAVAKKAEAQRARPRLPREELLARLGVARKSARAGGAIAMMFQKKPLDASTDDELQALLDDIELLDPS